MSADNIVIKDVQRDTQVTFPRRSEWELSPIIWAGPCAFPDGAVHNIVLAETTPFHPLDHKWPDQPGDSGTIEVNSDVFPVVDSIIGAVHKQDGTLSLGGAIPARRGDKDWAFVVAHIVGGDVRQDLRDLIGHPATLSVDSERRRRLSPSPSACHAASLALNKIVSELWRKEAKLDSLGNPNFDQLAMAESR